MVELLDNLRREYNATEVKAEFEAEASRIHEVMRLKEIADRAGFNVIIKIGGSEAITDMFEAQHIGVSGIVAPMVESAYALTKFLEAVNTHFTLGSRKRVRFGVNIETYHAYKELEKILKVPKLNILNKITVGRVDMVESMGLKRGDINTDKIYRITRDICKAAKKKKLLTAVGGGIDEKAVYYLDKLAKEKLLDFFETRKVVFAIPNSFINTKEGIIKANQFELLWLENKKNYYSKIYYEDDKRIAMLKKRIKLRF